MGRKKSKKKSRNWNAAANSFPWQVQESGCPNIQKDPTIIAEVESLFKKTFTYEKTENSKWTLPSPDHWYNSEPWCVDILQDFKKSLNAVKASLSEIDISDWHEHTQFTNRAGQVIQHVKRSRKPELCTQAWCKFHEIIASFPILPLGDTWASLRSDGLSSRGPGFEKNMGDSFCSVHLCEAPGAFITSLNHYMHCRGFSGNWSWLGNTLNPYYEGNSLSEMITDDRLILETLDNWYFGCDNTGNIMCRENVVGLMDRVSQLRPVDLVTCDGSIDCQDKPGEQETVVSPLHYSEVVASLLILSLGGSLVLKMFTLFESSSVCIMYLLNCVFSQVHVFKPATSKSGNSEVYVICIDYQPVGSSLKSHLLQLMGRDLESHPVFKLTDICPNFLREHQRCCQTFMTYQTQTIQENLRLYSDMSANTKTRISVIRHQCAMNYVERFEIKPLPSQNYIVPPFQVVGKFQDNFSVIKGRKPHTGSYIQRQNQLNIPWQQKLQNLTLYDLIDSTNTWIQSRSDLLEQELANWPVVRGRLPGTIECSLFCDTQILQLYNNLLLHQPDVRSDFQISDVLLKFLSRGDSKMEEDEAHSKHAVVMSDTLGSRSAEFSRHKQLEVISDDQDHESRVFFLDVELNNSVSFVEELLNLILWMFKSIEKGEKCVLMFPDVLTRSRAGILFILYASFEKILVEPVLEGHHSPLVALCTGFKCQDVPAVKSWIEKIIQSQGNGPETMQSILEFVPVRILLGEEFYHFVRETNEQHIKALSNYMISHQQSEKEVEVK